MALLWTEHNIAKYKIVYTHLKPKTKKEIRRNLRESSYDLLMIQFFTADRHEETIEALLISEINKRRREMPEITCLPLHPIAT